jgi:2-polyprenyl-3-methyl-5-hydroxy-6-metoxy-1,4-benzoquinol methylase
MFWTHLTNMTTTTLLFSLGILAAFLLSLPWLVRGGIMIHHAVHQAVSWRQRVQAHYRNQSATPWIFTWCKTRMDPMFNELPVFFATYQPCPPAAVLDVGCGYGITGCAMLEWFESARIHGLDPSKTRIKAAARAFGTRGAAVCGRAPQIHTDQWPASYDTIFALDMIHFLDDAELDLTLRHIKAALTLQGKLYLRATIPPAGEKSWLWRFDTTRRRWLGIPTHHRSAEKILAHLHSAGLVLHHQGPSGTNSELGWFIAGKPEKTTTPAT